MECLTTTSTYPITLILEIKTRQYKLHLVNTIRKKLIQLTQKLPEVFVSVFIWKIQSYFKSAVPNV